MDKERVTPDQKWVIAPNLYQQLIAEDPEYANYYEPWGGTPLPEEGVQDDF
jgi:hypothetical protein